MRKAAVFYAICMLNGMFVSLLGVPTASAQAEGWGVPRMIESDYGGNAVDPAVGIDSAGNAIVVWDQTKGTRRSIWSNRYVVGAGWGAPELIETNDATDASGAEIAVDPSGNATAVWRQGFPDRIWANRYVVGAGWGTPVLIETGGAGTSGVRVAVDPSGNVTAVWSEWGMWSNRYIVGAGWGTPELIETNATMGYYPELAVDSMGNAVAVWLFENGTSTGLWASRYVVGAGWGTAELIGTNEAGAAEHPRVAVDPSGNATAVWGQNDGYIRNITANRYVVGVGWGTPELIETNDTSDAVYPAVAVDASGAAMVVWTMDGIWSNRYVVGAGWGAAQLIAGRGYRPDLGVDPSGDAMVAWELFDGARTNVWASRYEVGVGWGAEILLEGDNAGNAFGQQVAVDQTGNAFVVWNQQDDVPFYGIRVNRYDVGTGWDVVRLISAAGPAKTEGGVSVAFDSNGNAIAVWLVRTAHLNVLASRYSAGQGWAQPVLIQTNFTEDALGPRLAVDASGNAMVVWYQWEGARFNVWSNRYTVGVGWGSAEQIDTSSSYYTYLPDVTLDPSGNAIVVWHQGDFGTGDIAARRYVVGTGWENVTLLESGPAQSGEPRIGSDAGGNATAAWFINNDIWASRYVAGVGWENATQIVSSSVNSYELDLAVSQNGNAAVTWHQQGALYCDVWAMLYEAGIGWGNATMIEDDNSGDTELNMVAMDPNGNAVVAWMEYTGPDVDIWANVYQAGVGWGNAQRLEQMPGYVSPPQVGMDSRGNAIVVRYQGEAGMMYSIFANRYKVGTGWGSAQPVEQNDGDAEAPGLAVRPDGTAMAVWGQQVTGFDYQLWSSWYTPPDMILPVADAGPDQTVNVGDIVGFDGSGSTDNVGIVSYSWTFDDGGQRTLLGETPTYSFVNSGVVSVALTVADAEANSDVDTVTITVNPAPDSERPVADAGPDQVVARGTTVTFDGSGSTDNVGVDNYTWIFDDGGTRTLYGNSPSYTFNGVGLFVVTLTVRDAAGNPDTDEVIITVTPPPDTEAPFAYAGPDRTIDAGTTIVLDGSGSTDNVGIANYTWSFDDGGMKYRYAMMWSYQFSNVGVFTITLDVRDAAGNLGTDTVVITVNPASSDTENPLAEAGPDQSVAAGALVTFDGSGSTDNVGIANYTWTFDDGGARTRYGVSPTYTFNNAGVFVVKLTVKDAAMNSGSDYVAITVSPPPDTEDPIASAGPDRNILAGTTIILDGSASADNVGIVNYTWRFDDAGTKYRYNVMFAYQFSNVGVFTVNLTVMDAAGNFGYDTAAVTVNPVTSDTERPIADAGPDQAVNTGTLVTFDGSGSTDNVGVTNHTWTFDDGGAQTKYGVSPTYTFVTAGTFVVTLTVRDAAGNSDEDVVVITVNPVTGDTERPIADAGPDQSVNAGTLVTFDGSGSTDNVGVTNHTWTFDDGGARTKYGVSPTHTFNSAGTFVVTLTVRDAAGNSDEDVVVITVNPVIPADTEPPVADAGDDQSIVSGSTTAFDGSGSTDNVGIVEYTWTFTYEGSARTLHGQMASFEFDAVGDYTVTLTVRDAAGNTDTDSVLVSVTAAPGGGTTKEEVMSSTAIALIAVFAVLAAIFAVMMILARRKKGGESAQVEETEAEEEAAQEETTGEPEEKTEEEV